MIRPTWQCYVAEPRACRADRWRTAYPDQPPSSLRRRGSETTTPLTGHSSLRMEASDGMSCGYVHILHASAISPSRRGQTRDTRCMLGAGKLTITLAIDCVSGARCRVIRSGTEPRSRGNFAAFYRGRTVRPRGLPSQRFAPQRVMTVHLMAATAARPSGVQRLHSAKLSWVVRVIRAPVRAHRSMQNVLLALAGRPDESQP